MSSRLFAKRSGASSSSSHRKRRISHAQDWRAVKLCREIVSPKFLYCLLSVSCPSHPARVRNHQPLMQSSAFPCTLSRHIIDLHKKSHFKCTHSQFRSSMHAHARGYTLYTLVLRACISPSVSAVLRVTAVLCVVKAFQQLYLPSCARIMIDGDCCCCVAFAGRVVVRTEQTVAERSSISICIYLD